MATWSVEQVKRGDRAAAPEREALWHREQFIIPKKEPT